MLLIIRIYALLNCHFVLTIIRMYVPLHSLKQDVNIIVYVWDFHFSYPYGNFQYLFTHGKITIMDFYFNRV